MNNRNIIGLVLAVIAVVMVCCIVTSSADASAVRFLGGAVWYLPYALAVGSIRFLKA